MARRITHKRGDTFSYVTLLPKTWPAGNWSAKCELDLKLKGEGDTFPVEATCEWIVYTPPGDDPENPGNPFPPEDRLRLVLTAHPAETETWPGNKTLTGDVQMSREADIPGDPPYVISTRDFEVEVLFDRTSP